MLIDERIDRRVDMRFRWSSSPDLKVQTRGSLFSKGNLVSPCEREKEEVRSGGGYSVRN